MAPNGEKHVMLSYNHKSKHTVTIVYNVLRAENIPVWFDDRDMEDNMYDSMAEAVENASIVCCFMSPEYETSPNCKLELEHAQRRRKRIIPCMISDRKVWKPSPSKWLDLITGSILAIDFSDTSESNIDLKTRELVDRIRNPSLVPPTESILAPSQLFEPIRYEYLRNDSIKRIMNEERCFPIEQSYINLAMVETKEQNETEKKLEQQEKIEKDHGRSQHKEEIIGTFEEIYGTKTSIDVKEIFDNCKDRITKKVLVLGRAGIGKSTFCRYVTYQWAKGDLWPQYELVILIQLRKLTTRYYPLRQSYSLLDLVKKEYFYDRDLSEDEENILRVPYDKSKVLWLLDGYDEFAENIPAHLEDLVKQLLTKTHHILTSRPYAVALAYDVKLEITGFTNDNIVKYVEQFFYQIQDTLKDASFQGQKLLNFLKSNPSIWGVAHIPVNLELISSLWGDADWSDTNTMTMTTLYDTLTEWLCRRYLTKRNLNHQKLTKKAMYTQCQGELHFLESLAFNAMESNTIILQPTLLQQIENETECSLIDHPQLLNIGILKSYDQKPTGCQIETEKQHYFVHLSFQEHFAARNLVKSLMSFQKQKGIDFIQNHKYNQRFTLVFIFAAGLLTQLDNQTYLEIFWSTIEAEPLDLVGIRHIKLIIDCIDELNGSSMCHRRAAYIKSIAHWIKISCNANDFMIIDHLIQSLKRTAKLASEAVIQNTFIGLLQSQEQMTKVCTCYVMSKITIANPRAELILALIPTLINQSSGARESACKALGNLGEKAATSEVINGLLNALADDSSSIRNAASEALLNMGDKAASSDIIHRLLDMFYDMYSTVTSNVRQMLVNFGGKAATIEVVDGLVNLLQKDRWNVHGDVCDVLVKIGKKAEPQKVIGGLLRALRDEGWAVRLSVCEIFDEISDRVATQEVIDNLLNTLSDIDWRVGEKACEVLVKISEKTATTEIIDGLFSALEDGNQHASRSACKAFGKMGEKVATSEVIARLLNIVQDKSSEVRSEALEALSKLGAKAVTSEVISSVLSALQDEDGSVRFAACEFIGYMNENQVNKEMIIGLINALQEKNSYVQDIAYKALVRMGKKTTNNTVIVVLIDALRDENWRVRESVCEVFGRMSEKAATNDVINALLHVLRDEHWWVRSKACESLGKMGETGAKNEVMDGLLNALRDENNYVRRNACEAIGNMGERAVTSVVIAGLFNAIRDADWDVKDTAHKTIVKIAEKVSTSDAIGVFFDALQDDTWAIVECALEVFVNMGEKVATNEVISSLCSALGSWNKTIRENACKALGNMGQKAATNEVIGALSNALQDEWWKVQSAACEAFSNIGKKAATNELIDALLNAVRHENDGVRWEACKVLGNIGEKVGTSEVIGALLIAIRDENASVRQIACESLVKVSDRVSTSEVTDTLLNALCDKEKAVRDAACKTLVKISEKVTTTEMIGGLLSILEHDNQDVRKTTCHTLCMMKEKAGTTEVLSALVHVLVNKKNDLGTFFTRDGLANVLSCWQVVTDLDADMLSKLYSLIRNDPALCRRIVCSDQFIKVFLETGNDAWLPLAVYCSLLNGNGVTASGNRVVIFSSKEPIELYASRLELICKLIKSFSDQRQELEGISPSVQKSERKTIKRSSVCQLM